MNLAYPHGLLLAWLALALAGCQRDNPDFNADLGHVDTGTSDGGSSTTSTASTTQSSSSTTDNTTTGDGDGDGDTGPVDTSMEAPDPIDLGEPACMVETHAAPSLRMGEPAQFDGGVCPPEHGMWVRKFGQLNGNLLATPCTLVCGMCDPNTQMEIGVSGGVSLPTLLPLVNDQQMQWMNCHYVEVAGLIAEEAGGCFYSSLSLHGDEGPSSPLLVNVNRDGWGLTPGAAAQLLGWHPMLVEQDVEQCACEQLNIDCCPGSNVVAQKFHPSPQLAPDLYVYPGEQVQLSLLLGNNAMVPFTFKGIQAQSGTNCEVSPESSWALFGAL